MAALVPTIKDKEFVNWLKGALALLFAKQGLEDFVSDELTDFQKDLLADIFKNNALPAGTVCTSCTTENVLDCPTQNFCPRGRCRLHDSGQTDKRPNQPCPNRLCQDIRDCIRREHRYNGPSWKNSNARRWSNDPFEIGKCFMPPDGYSSVQTLADTDFNGTLAVIINNKRFQNKMAAHLNQSKNVCFEARDVGRKIRHSADFTLTDMDLKRYIDILIKLLSDPKYLATDQKAKDAVDKLNQLEANTLSIRTEDITCVIDAAIRESVKAEGDIAIKAISKALEEVECQSHQLLKDVRSSIASVKIVTADSLDKIIAEKVSAIDDFKMIAEKEKQELKNIGSSERLLLQEEVKKEKDRQQRSAGLSSIIQSGFGFFRKRRLRKSMKEDLISFYRKCHSTIPVSPLVEEHDVPLTDFYVQPPLTSIDVQSKFRHFQQLPKKTPIDSFRDLFLTCDGKLYNDIYVTAKAGVGKTSFTKKVCMTWCQAHNPVKQLKRKFKPDDLDTMSKFEFLFMVSLREIKSSECDLESMIKSNLLNSLKRHSRYSRLDVEDILNEKTCLVILDGLDEWTHPTSCDRGCRDVHAIPHKPTREECTVMTTTRPWKLDVVRLGTSQIDRHVEVNELEESTSKELICNAVTVLNKQSPQNQPKTVEAFERETSTMKLDNLRYIPYILLQIICLWFDGKSIGRTKCEIYSNIITLTVSRGLIKLEKIASPPRRNRILARAYDIPPCLQLNAIFKSHYDVYIGLAKLAFEKLFSLNAERNLVFDKSEVLCIISEDILRFCLEIGLLSQTKDYGSVSERRSTLSFQHKSIQEYFAALYIQSHSDNQDIQESIRKVCNTLPAILEMSNVFIFLTGLNSVACMQIFQIFKGTLSADETIVQYFRNNLITGQTYVPRLLEYWENMKSWQCMLTDSVQEIINTDGDSNIPLYIEDIIIDSTITIDTLAILKILSENINNKIKSMSITECRSTEDFTEKLEALDLQDMHLLHKLVINAVPKEQDLNRLLSGPVHTLTCLHLNFAVFRNNLMFKHITEISSETVSILLSMDNLQIICLVNIRLQHAGIEHLFQYLMTRQTLALITLTQIECKDHDNQCNGFCLDLSQHKNLKDLSLDSIPVSMLRVHSPSLEGCQIGKLQPAVQSSFVQCLPATTNLTIVAFSHFEPEQSAPIIDTLSVLPKLETISIQSTDLGDTPLSLPRHMKHLEFVSLYRVTLISTALRKLLDSVRVLPKQVTVIMKACTVIAETYFTQMKEEIRLSPKYQVMSDGWNEAGEDLFSFQTKK